MKQNDLSEREEKAEFGEIRSNKEVHRSFKLQITVEGTSSRGYETLSVSESASKLFVGVEIVDQNRTIIWLAVKKEMRCRQCSLQSFLSEKLTEFLMVFFH